MMILKNKLWVGSSARQGLSDPTLILAFLHTVRTTIKAWMSLNFGKIPLLTSELAALEGQKN